MPEAHVPCEHACNHLGRLEATGNCCSRCDECGQDIATKDYGWHQRMCHGAY